MPEPKNRELTIAFTVATVLAFAVLDYAILAIEQDMHGDPVWLGVAAFGFLMAQTMLIAIWAVFSPVNVVLRLSCWLLFAMTTWYVLVFATVVHDGGLQRAQSRDFVVFGILILSGATLLQIPLWIAKRALRFRLIRPGEEPTPVASERLQFQLIDLLIATFILAIVMSPIRLVLPREGFLGPRLFPELFVVIPIAMAVILVATLPSLWAAFVASPAFVPVLALAMYSVFISIIELAIIYTIEGPRGGPSFGEVFGVFFMGNLSQSAVVFAVMRIYYALGFRLQRVPRRAVLPPEAVA
jgi:hypothetical protein